MEALHGVINDINSFLWTYVIIIALIGIGIIFTLRTKFVQLRLLGEMVKLIFGSAGQKTSGKEVSGFQAFSEGFYHPSNAKSYDCDFALKRPIFLTLALRHRSCTDGRNHRCPLRHRYGIPRRCIKRKDR